MAVWTLLTRECLAFRLLLSLALGQEAGKKTILPFVVHANSSKSHRTSAAWLIRL